MTFFQHFCHFLTFQRRKETKQHPNPASCNSGI